VPVRAPHAAKSGFASAPMKAPLSAHAMRAASRAAAIRNP
jgi:hypothetical protein